MTILIPFFLSRQTCGIYLPRGKEFRNYGPKVFESEEYKSTGEWWR